MGSNEGRVCKIQCEKRNETRAHRDNKKEEEEETERRWMLRYYVEDFFKFSSWFLYYLRTSFKFQVSSFRGAGAKYLES